MVATQLKLLINELGISQRQFALKINLDPGYLSRILQGKVIPPERILLLIENVFNVNHKWIVTGEGETFSTQGISLIKKQIAETIDSLDDRQVEALKAFLKYLQQEKNSEK